MFRRLVRLRLCFGAHAAHAAAHACACACASASASASAAAHAAAASAFAHAAAEREPLEYGAHSLGLRLQLRLHQCQPLLERGVLRGEARDTVAQHAGEALRGGGRLLQLVLLLLEEEEPLLVDREVLPHTAGFLLPLLLVGRLALADLVGDDLEGHRRREHVGARVLELALELGGVCLVELREERQHHALVVVASRAQLEDKHLLGAHVDRRRRAGEGELGHVDAHGEAREEGRPQLVGRGSG